MKIVSVNPLNVITMKIQINLFMKMKKLEFKIVIFDISDDFSDAMNNAACKNRI